MMGAKRHVVHGKSLPTLREDISAPCQHALQDTVPGVRLAGVHGTLYAQDIDQRGSKLLLMVSVVLRDGLLLPGHRALLLQCLGERQRVRRFVIDI